MYLYIFFLAILIPLYTVSVESENVRPLQLIHQASLREGKITAVVNKYVDKLFINIQKMILQKGIDPYEMEDQQIKLPLGTASLNLTKGWLQNLSTICRDGEVSLTYKSMLKKLSATVSIKFKQDLLMTYRYFTKVLLISINGDVAGKVSNIRATVSLAINLENHQLSLETFDITNTGSISLTFSGHDYLDWMMNWSTQAVTVVFHSLILRVVQFVLETGLLDHIEKVNDLIYNILNGNKTILVNL